MTADQMIDVVVLALVVGVFALVIWCTNRLMRTANKTAADDSEPCEGCGYDLRVGHLRCPECGEPTAEARRQHLRRLLEEWPSNGIEPRKPRADEFPEVVFASRDGGVAWLLRDHLVARGVACEVRTPGTTLSPVTMQTVTGDFQLIVWTDDFAAAKEIIARLLPKGMVAQAGLEARPASSVR